MDHISIIKWETGTQAHMYLPRHTYTYRHTHIEVHLYVQLCGNLFFKDITATSFGGEHNFSIIPKQEALPPLWLHL